LAAASRREKLVLDEMVEFLDETNWGVWIASGKEASVILAQVAKATGGPEWLKRARKEAEGYVDARTRSGIPLTRFNKKEEAAWCEEEEDSFYNHGLD